MSTDTPTGLPHWETIPDDIPAATREIKQALRARIEASGRSVADVFADRQVIARGLRIEPEGVPGVRTPIRFSDAELALGRASPKLGADG